MSAQYRFSLVYVLGLLTFAAGAIVIAVPCLAMAVWVFGFGESNPQPADGFGQFGIPGATSLGITPDAALCFILCGVSLWILRKSAGKSLAVGGAKTPIKKFLVEAALMRSSLVMILDEDSERACGVDSAETGQDGRLEEKSLARGFLRRVAQSCALVASAIGGVALAKYARHLLSFGDWLAQSGAVLGHWGGEDFSTRMAPSVALAFLLNGVALATLDVETRQGMRPSQYLGLMALFLSLMPLLGRAYQTPFFAVGDWPEMTGPVAGAFIALSIGTVCARPRSGLMALLTSGSAGGYLARRMLPAAILVPVTFGWLRLLGERAGYFDKSFGIPLLTLVNVLFFLFLVWRGATSLHNLDAERTSAETSLYKAYSDLQKRVAEQISELSRANQDLWAEMIERERIEEGARQSREELAELKHSEARLRESVAQLQLIADSAPVMIWMAGPDKVCDFFNKGWLDYTGRTLEQELENGWVEGIHPEDFERCLETYVEAFGRRREFRIEHRLRRRDGQYRWVLNQGAPRFDRDGVLAGYIGSCIDIHERRESEESLRSSQARQMEKERDELLAREQAAREQAEEANRLKDEFLATVSHELRAPLNAIQGWVKLLRGGRLNPEETARALETIERSTRAQNRIISDLLDVSRIITGKLRMNVRPINLASVIESAVEALRPAADAKEIAIDLVINGGAGMVSGDSDRMRQIVWNLVSNAIKFTPNQGRVQVRLERAGADVEIIVSDTGAGIDPAFLPYVFDRFRQGDSSSTRRQGGLGLGLAIVRHLTEIHGGSVRAESEGPGQGATFVVRLPLIAQGHLKDSVRMHPITETAGAIGAVGIVRQAGASASTMDQAPDLDGLRVLAVDDDSDARDLIRTILTQCGARVETAGSTEQALDVFDRPEEWQPELLISDIEMPEADGYQLIGKLRELESQRGRRIPAIALTAYARAEDRLRSLSAGFQMHVTKPVEPAELLTIVASLTGRLSRQRDLYEVSEMIRQEARTC